MEEVKVQFNFNTKLLNAVLNKIDTGNNITIVDQTEMDNCFPSKLKMKFGNVKIYLRKRTWPIKR